MVKASHAKGSWTPRKRRGSREVDEYVIMPVEKSGYKQLKIRYKVKGKKAKSLCFFFTEHHAMKVYWGVKA
jgi:hypothetical protein